MIDWIRPDLVDIQTTLNVSKRLAIKLDNIGQAITFWVKLIVFRQVHMTADKFGQFQTSLCDSQQHRTTSEESRQLAKKNMDNFG